MGEQVFRLHYSTTYIPCDKSTRSDEAFVASRIKSRGNRIESNLAIPITVQRLGNIRSNNGMCRKFTPTSFPPCGILVIEFSLISQRTKTFGTNGLHRIFVYRK